MKPIYCFEKNKLDRSIGGKCLKIVPLRNNINACCLLIVKHPLFLMTDLLFEKSENPNELDKISNPKKFKYNVIDAMQLSFQGKQILVVSTVEGKIVQCSVEKDTQAYTEICQLNSKSTITSIGFLDCGKKFNQFMLDTSGYLWRLEGESLQLLKNEPKIIFQKRNIVLIKTAPDFSSVLLIDKEGQIHLLLSSQQNPAKSQESFIQLSFNMNDKCNSLLKPNEMEQQKPILSDIIALDFSIKQQILKIYASNNINLIAIECTILFDQSQSTFEIAQMFNLDQSKGAVNQIFAYGNSGRPSFAYEIAIIQEKCVQAFNITNEFSKVEIWSFDSKASNPQLAQLYEFDCFGTRNRHLLHYLPLATEEMKQNKSKEFQDFKYDERNSKISAFYLDE